MDALIEAAFNWRDQFRGVTPGDLRFESADIEGQHILAVDNLRKELNAKKAERPQEGA